MPKICHVPSLIGIIEAHMFSSIFFWSKSHAISVSRIRSLKARTFGTFALASIFCEKNKTGINKSIFFIAKYSVQFEGISVQWCFSYSSQKTAQIAGSTIFWDESYDKNNNGA